MIWLSPIFIARTKILSYNWDSAIVRNNPRLLVGTSLRGRMIMVTFSDLYVYIWSDMIFDFLYKQEKISIKTSWGWEWCWSRTLSQLFPLIWAPRVGNWGIRVLGVEGTLENMVLPLYVSHRVEGFSLLYGLCRLYTSWHHPTNRACWEHYSSFGQRVEGFI